MKRFLITLVALVSIVILAACSSSNDSFATSEAGGEDSVTTQSPSFVRGAPGLPGAISAPAAPRTSAVIATPAPSAPSPEFFNSGDGNFAGEGALQFAERQIISTGSISVEVEGVQEAINRVKVVAENFGGFVERLSSFGNDDRQSASMTVRVPQAQFEAALDQIRLLGVVQSENIGSDDVSEQFIDLEARLKSALREEDSLLSLLSRSLNISDIISIERELARVRSTIEQLQGQLNFLERRVDLSTIFIELFPPEEDRVQPPSAFLAIKLSDVSGRVAELRALAESFDGQIDRVVVSERNGIERAELTLVVFAKDFRAVLASIESVGKIDIKETNQATDVSPDPKAGDKPDSRIDITLEEKEGNIAALIGIIIGVVVVVGLIVVVPFLSYRTGHRRGSKGQEA